MLGWNKKFKFIVTSQTADSEEMEKRNEYISTTEKLTKFVQETSQGIKRKQASQKEKLLQVQKSNTNVQINISKGFKRFNRRQDKTKDYILEKLKDKFVHL